MLGFSKNSMETLLVNLKVISKIECGDRLYSNKKFLELDKSRSFIISFLRWWKEESREKTLNEIHNNLDNAFTCITNSKIMKNENDNEILYSLLFQLEHCKKGIINLKKTYDSDATIEAKLEVEIQLIERYIKEGREYLKDVNYAPEEEITD